ncbi:hypothetical protein MHYP_G00337970 [Metynnis hypsauchen]
MKVLGGVKISRSIKNPPNPPQRFRRRPTLHFLRLALSYRTALTRFLGQSSIMSAHQRCESLLIILCSVLTMSSSSDPCFNYTVLDEPWRATNFSNRANPRCDTSDSWVGWYRLMYNGQDVRMPELCVNAYMCGTNGPLWINGVHPQLQDGVVTLQICGSWAGDCCYFKSKPIRVKACSGNYYVYEIVNPFGCAYGYCADITALKPVSYPKTKQLVRLRLSSLEDFKQSSTRTMFLSQLKEELVRKGLPTNITLHLKSISKQKNVKSEMYLEPGTC